MSKLTKLIWIGLAAVGLATAPATAEVPAGTRADMFVESRNAVLVDTFSDRDVILPGEAFTLAARIVPFHNDEISFHIYSAEPSPDWSYVPSAATMDAADGVEWGEFTFPPGEQHDSQLWLIGQPVIEVTGKLAEDAAPGPRTFTAQLIIAACTEEMCLAPSQVELKWNLEVAAAAAPGTRHILSQAELTAPVEVDYSRFNLPESPGELGGGLQLESGEAPPAKPGAGVDLGNLNINAGTSWPLWKILLFAMLGGLILNVMPCVLPVVSIKVIDLVGSRGKEPREVIAHGLVFAAGIISTFLLGALVIAAIQGFGTQLGWGSQFQSPGFIIIMATIMFVFGLSLVDVFKIKASESVTTGAGSLAKTEGVGGSFFKGVLATLLGTPCVGPFLGPALLVAFTLTWLHTLMIFFFVGLGMALPYLVLIPFLTRMSKRDRGRLSRKLQGSKDWLNDFKVVMAFLLFATVVYLLYILQGVLGGIAVIWALMFLVCVGFASWLWARIVGLGRRFIALAWILGLVVLLLGAWFAIPRVYEYKAVAAAGPETMHGGWESFSLSKLQTYTSQGKTVLVDFTADWCPNCKTNEAVSLNIDSTMELKDKLGIIFLVADWTARDEEIGNALRALGFASVPLTAIFPGNDPSSPILLDGVYSPARLHDAMREAAGAAGRTVGAETQETDQGTASDQSAADMANLSRPDLFIESRFAVLVDPIQDRTQVHPGEEFTLATRLIPFKNKQFSFHIYGAEPSPDWDYVPSVAQMDPADGAVWSEFVFPPGEEHESQRWLTGQPVIYATGKLAADAAPGPRAFSAQLMFSACTEEMCLAPSQVELRWNVEVLPKGANSEEPVLSLEELKAPVTVDLTRYQLPELDGDLGGGLDLGAAAK